MQTSFEFELECSNSTPLDHVYFKEFSEGLMKLGSLISIIENKKINTTLLFSLILESAEYQKLFVEITASKNLKTAIYNLLQLHPKLVKSKITKSVVKKLNASSSIRSGKGSLQQAPSNIKKRKKQTI